jgi:hypothetical protein
MSGSCVDGVSILLSLVLTAGLSGGAHANSSQFVQQQAFRTPGGGSGLKVVLSGDGHTALVGAISGTSTGVAYVFTKQGAAWTEQTLAPSDGTNTLFFGVSVALSNDGRTALVGAYGKNDFAGAVYVFTYAHNSWRQQQELVALDGAANDFFGLSVALSDDGHTALIGVPLKNGSKGAAYIFTCKHNTWTQQQELVALDGAAGDGFGGSVALANKGHVALIGASDKNDNTGAAYVFKRDHSIYTQQQELTAFDGAANNAFGASVALSNDGHTALIGAFGHNSFVGAAYVFNYDDNAWTQQQELVALDGATYDSFGDSVALSNDGHVALIGAFGKNIYAGAAYVFAYDHNTYSQRQELVASDGTHGGQFGFSLSLENDGRTAFIGANFDSGGSAYIFEEH